jgi:hypothetical protein
MDLKPDVCWQLPLRRQDTGEEGGRVVTTVRQWDRADWGDGGLEFHWWCTESSDAFGGRSPVYRHLRDELSAMIGPPVYGMLAAYLDARLAETAAGRPVTLPHPAVRRR